MCQEQHPIFLEYSELNCLNAEGYCIYKGTSLKYKGKIRKYDISVLAGKHNFVEYLRWLAAFLRS